MAAATCTAAGLIEGGACFTQKIFSAHDQKAIIAYLWWQLADNVTAVPTTLDEQLASASCIKVLSNDQMQAGTIAVLNRGVAFLQTLTINGGGLEVLTSATAASAIACLKNVDDNTLDTIILYNTCVFFSGFV